MHAGDIGCLKEILKITTLNMNEKDGVGKTALAFAVEKGIFLFFKFFLSTKIYNINNQLYKTSKCPYTTFYNTHTDYMLI